MENIVFEESEKNYYLNLREFSSGAFEAVLKAVRPMKQEQIEASMSGIPSFSSTLSEYGLTRSDLYPKFRRTEEPEEKSAFEKTQNHNRAVRRAKQNIRWLCKVMDADRLFTLTYRENQTDREQARADFTKFLRLVRSGWRGQVGVPNWQYVAVLERQERGAFHVHCAVKGWQKVKFLRAAWYKALGGQGDETGDKTPGAVNVTNPDKKRWGHTGRQWRVNKLSAYLTKYLSKTFDETASEKKRYWHCRDLKHPVKQRFWIGGACMADAIKETVSMLGFHCNMGGDFNMWVSTLNDSFWIAGRSESD